mgnify:CR=1 FL=1
MSINYFPYDRRLTPRAQELRHDMTPQERKLWFEFLRSYPVKFYKQRVIEYYIADFYCGNFPLYAKLCRESEFCRPCEFRDDGEHF